MSARETTTAAPMRAQERQARRRHAALSERVALDVMRGWSEQRDPQLRSAHVLPALAKLVPLDGGVDLGIHAPSILFGRFHPQTGPVDLVPYERLDHELYRIGAPHARLTLEDSGVWTMRPMTTTLLRGRVLDADSAPTVIDHGAILGFGTLAYKFEVTDEKLLGQWLRIHSDMLKMNTEPTLFLKRRGGLCGPRYTLESNSSNVIGRSFPGAQIFGADAEKMPAPPDWDLAGLYEHERRHVAFRHLSVRRYDDQSWEVVPLTRRHKVYVNRVRIHEPQQLEPGDEIGLDSVLLHFHDPSPKVPVRSLADLVGATKHPGMIRGEGETRDDSHGG